ncbi:MAG: Re/Si-specific NAD(P)(+) transhydrogenase subunit alpha [Deltaproteobacteria bacterium]|nr:Re/Si-specific NAD(P)(+) transhydrogenase subunit alpha [Deltaproteobacteria bacterium]
MTTLFIPKEITLSETRVAATPETVRKFIKLGFQVLVEKGAGDGSFITDKAFEEAGASLIETAAAGYSQADIILKLHPPSPHPQSGQHEAALFKQGAIIISFLWPFANPATIELLAKKRVSAFAMDLLPRISRAQKADALSSQSNLAGYKAVMLAANYLSKIFPLMTTAAGTISPAKVVILGAGVAGLQAIATAKRLGAVVEVSDVRPAVKEQVESLGGRFIMVEGSEALVGTGGYAKEASPEFLKKQQELVGRHIMAADVVITTALVPGKPAPKLIPASMVKQMKRGSVIVDLAVEQGGNCELSEVGKIVVKEGVTLIGLLNLPGLVPLNASQVYAKNLLAVVENLYPKGNLALNFDDEINAASFVTHDGKIRLPNVTEFVSKRGSHGNS